MCLPDLKMYVDAVITICADGLDLGLYGGFVVITGGGQTYRVPFMGLKGDYTKMNVLRTVAYGSIDSCEYST